MLVDRYQDDKGDLFLKFFLIDSSKNNRQWATTDQANERYARTAIGTPLTLMLNKEDSKYHDYHPFLPSADSSPKEQIDFAYQYAIGQIVDVSKESGKYKAAYANDNPWFATVKITDPTAKEELQKPTSALVPQAVSPGIIHYSGPDDAISEYHIVHLAAVPNGAYGPRAIKWASCNGDALSCIPQLKAASYKERTNTCALQSLSSLAQKSASETHNQMSMSSSGQPVTPGPQSFGTGTVETTAPNQNNNDTQGKPTIRIRRLSKEKPEGEQEGEQPAEGENTGEEQQQQQQTTSAPGDVDQSFKNSRYYGELQSLKKELQSRTQQWDSREKQYQLEKIIPPQLFTDSRGRFNQRAWEAEIQKAMKETASLELLAEYYQTKLMAMQVPEIKTPVKHASSKGASSQSYDEDEEDRERRMKLTELGKMVRGL